VVIRDQERYIISLPQSAPPSIHVIILSYLNRFSPQNEESFRTLGQESSELVNENMLNLIRLLNLDADADAVDARFDEYFLIVVACYS
jgi:hypothetical protein